jgi:hypothetical protein
VASFRCVEFPDEKQTNKKKKKKKKKRKKDTLKDWFHNNVNQDLGFSIINN